jgi:hypothetical protein
MNSPASDLAMALMVRSRRARSSSRVRMQEHREILADRLVAPRRHLRRRGADDDPVAVLHRQAEKLVAHCAADGVRLHAGGDR